MHCAASGESPLLLAASVHCATRAAINEARKQIRKWRWQDESDYVFQLEVPATLPVVKEAGGLNCVESYLKWIYEVEALWADQNTGMLCTCSFSSSYASEKEL